MTVTPARGAGPSQRLLVVAAAGYGKTSALEADSPKNGWRGSARALLEVGIPDAPHLSVDELDELSPAGQLALIRQLSAVPREVGFILAARAPLDPEVRRHLRGQVFERGPADLALSPREIARVLDEEYGVSDPEAPATVAALTRGWAALVHFAADALARRGEVDLHAELTRADSDAASWLRTTVLDELPPTVTRVLSLVVGCDPLAEGLVDTVLTSCGRGVDREALTWLRRVGLVVPYRRPVSGGAAVFTLVPVVSGVLASAGETGGLSPGRAALTAAADWYAAHDLPYAAALAHERLGNTAPLVHLLTTRGDDMVAHGHAAGVVELVERHTDSDSRLPALQWTYAAAHRHCGNAGAAQRAFAPLVEAADRQGWNPALAHAVAGVHYLRGDLAGALEVLDRVARGAAPDRHGVEWLACRAHVASLLGDVDAARACSAEALAQAERLGDARALAAAHLACAKVATSARKEAHLTEALTAATAAGDLVASARVLVSQSYVLLTAARFRDAVPVCREAVAAADSASPPGMRAAALHNLGEALSQVGEYDEARWQLRRAIGLARTLGPGRTAMGLVGIAEISRHLGHDDQCRGEYAEAVTLARSTGERQVLVPALAGAARLLRESDPTHAKALVDEAMATATGGLAPVALVAAGWVALSRGDRTSAVDYAVAAAVAARAEHEVGLLAEALELTAAAATEPGLARAALSEALSIWRGGGAGPAAARVEVRLGRLDDADSSDRSRARDGTRALHQMGVVRIDGRPLAEEPMTKQVAVAVLGGFTVTVAGQPVPLTAWRSRQARTLVKILASRRGRPATRAYLCETLWPDDDPARTGHRLSVLLATVRGVLDPERSWPPERYLASDSTGIWLDLRHVALDADRLLQDAAHASDLLAGGDLERAREILTDVDARYRGDAFEDEPYEEWTDGMREQARGAWLRCLRQLATIAQRASRGAEALDLYVRLLVADPHDERVHRTLVKALVRAGRHGEARRAFDRWAQAMEAVDAPRPHPSILTGADALGGPHTATSRHTRTVPVLTSR